ncbi:hypothetical protein GCM10025857_06860 [Alicyclobacillus contaminans]|nr:hypothetical protein GCM10025857_06860 [Alicyclobacillus contaminans]
MPDVDDVLQTGGSGDGDEHAPGSAAWEQKDVELMQQAVQGLVALKGLINQIALREQAEVMHGDGDDVEQVNDLLNALDAVSFALQQVAGAAAVEQAEAEEAGAVTKAGRKMSKDSMTKVHDAMTNLAKAAGFKGVGDFHEACKSMGICKEEDDDQPDDADKSKEKPEDKGDPENTEKAKEKGKEKSEGDDKKPDDKEEPDGEDGRTETKKSEASGESLAAEAVVKALEATGLTTLAKSAGDLLKATEVIKSLEERVKAIEEQPMPGGPMLRGAATAHDYYLVRKGEGPDLNQPGVLEQAAQQVSDPYVRDVLNREVARRMHPAFRQQQQA